MKRPIFQELRNVEESDNKIIEDYKRKEENTIAAKCNIKIKDKEIKAIIDIGAARNIMSKVLKEKLGLKKNLKSKLLKIDDKRRKIKIPIMITRKDEEEYESEEEIEDEAYYLNSTDSEIEIASDVD